MQTLLCVCVQLIPLPSTRRHPRLSMPERPCSPVAKQRSIGTVRTVHFDLLQTTVVPGSPEAPLDSALSGSPWASLMPPPLPEVRVQGMAYPTSSYLKHINNDYNWIPSTMGSFSLTMYSNSPKMDKQKPTLNSVNVVFATFFLVTDLQVRLSTLSNRSRTRCGLIDCLRACQLLVSSRIGYPVPCIALLPVFLGLSLAFPLDFCLDLDFSSPLLSIGLLRLGLGLGLPPLHPLHLPLRNLT